MVITRSVTTDLPATTAFRYMSDFENTTTWDPGTVVTRRISGDGGLGTRYANTSRFLGNTTELVYVVTGYQQDRSITLVGENRSVVATDSITVEPTGPATSRLTYRAQFRFKGLLRLATPLLAPALHRLGNQAEQGMRRTFTRMAAG